MLKLHPLDQWCIFPTPTHTHTMPYSCSGSALRPPLQHCPFGTSFSGLSLGSSRGQCQSYLTLAGICIMCIIIRLAGSEELSFIRILLCRFIKYSSSLLCTISHSFNSCIRSRCFLTETYNCTNNSTSPTKALCFSCRASSDKPLPPVLLPLILPTQSSYFHIALA